MNFNVARLSELVLGCLISLFLLCINSFAQTGTPSPQPSPMPAQQSTPAPTPSTSVANPADVGSIDAILSAVYDVISGPAGKKRDWDRMRSLFIPGARLIPTGPRPGGVTVLVY